MNNIQCLQGKENFHFVSGDIRSYQDVANCVRLYQIDTILHFAAKSHVGNSFADPIGFTVSNVLGTTVLLEAARQYGVTCFLHFSTDEVYGEPISSDAEDAVESSSLRPTNPYAGTKAAAEMIVLGYMASFNLPVLIIRSNNAYGPCQYPEKIIPRFSLRLGAGLKLPLHGIGDNTRRYLYASDLTDAVDTVLHRGKMGEVYNVASEDELSNKQLCEKLLQSFGLKGDAADIDGWVVRTPDRLANDSAYLVNGEKLKALGWRQKVSFKEGLRRTVEWYKLYGERWWGSVDDVLQDVSKENHTSVVSTDSKSRTDMNEHLHEQMNGHANGYTNGYAKSHTNGNMKSMIEGKV